MHALYYAQTIGTGTRLDPFRSALAEWVVEGPEMAMEPLVRGREYWWVEGPRTLHDALSKDARVLAITPVFADSETRDAWLQGTKADLDAAALTRLRTDGVTTADVTRASRTLDLLKKLMWKLGVSR